MSETSPPARPALLELRRLPEARRLRATWSDGAELEIPYDTLRGWCPCAMCQGHGSLHLRYHEPPAPVEPETIRPVGRYAVSILWSDGHGTGIYRFDLLRRLGDLEGGEAVLEHDG